MGMVLGKPFLSAVRQHFAPLFDAYGFAELESRENNNFCSITLKNERQYLRISCDYRDSVIDVGSGRAL